MSHETDTLSIAERRAAILERLEVCAKDKAPSLVAVSKVQPDDRVSQMLAAGQTVFGENRVQEAKARWGERFVKQRESLSLHLIGPLQTNKAEEAARFFDVIETLDREKLAKALAKARDKVGYLPKLFVQVNTGAESQKAGILPEELEGFIKILHVTYDIHPEGLMCLPPANEAPSPHFWMLRDLARRNDLPNLSMGMSGDYEIAAKLGATHVRVGSALFGARVKP